MNDDPKVIQFPRPKSGEEMPPAREAPCRKCGKIVTWRDSGPPVCSEMCALRLMYDGGGESA